MTCFFPDRKIWFVQKKLSKLQNNIPTPTGSPTSFTKKIPTISDRDFNLFVIEY